MVVKAIQRLNSIIDFALAAKMAFVHTAVFRTLLYKIPPDFFLLIYKECAVLQAY